MRRIRPSAIAIVSAVGVMIVGCQAPTNPSPAPDGSLVPSPTQDAAPAFVPGGTAEENRPWFDLVNRETLAGSPKASSREMVDALVAAGFDKAEMEVTFDRTNVDLEADYVIVSVKIGEACLIGQRGDRGYASTIQPPLGTGTCLIGHTQPIDW